MKEISNYKSFLVGNGNNININQIFLATQGKHKINTRKVLCVAVRFVLTEDLIRVLGTNAVVYVTSNQPSQTQATRARC